MLTQKLLELSYLFLTFVLLYKSCQAISSNNNCINWMLFSIVVFTTIFKDDYNIIQTLHPYSPILFLLNLFPKLKTN